MKIRKLFVLLVLIIGVGLVTVLALRGWARRLQMQKAAVTVAQPPVEARLPEGLLSKCQDDLADICFPPAANGKPVVGFAVGCNETIIRTADGGRTWMRVIPRKQKGHEFNAVHFSSSNDGWAVSRSLLLRTADGGLTWQPAKVLPGNFYYYGPSAARPECYYQMQTPTCGADIWRTTDGAAWKAMPVRLPRNDYEALFVLDEMRMWVVGNYGRLARTSDGGATWIENNIPDGGHLVQVQFVNPDEGWIRVIFGQAAEVLHSSDGGQTWLKQPLAGIESFWTPVDMQIIDARTGWVLVDAGKRGGRLMRTTDGGQTWTLIKVFPARLAAFSMIDGHRGWLAAATGEIFEFDDSP